MVVLIRIVKQNPEGKLLTQYQNVNVLIGAAANVDPVQAQVDAFVGGLNGTFEKVDRVRKM